MGPTQQLAAPRDWFLEAARKELIAFERRENEFRKMLRRERAEQLQFPADKTDLVRSLSN
jgi:hypothetical protein